MGWACLTKTQWRIVVDIPDLPRVLRRAPRCYHDTVTAQRESMNVGLGHTSLVVAASDGPGG